MVLELKRPWQFTAIRVSPFFDSLGRKGKRGREEEGKEREREREREGKGREGKGREGKGIGKAISAVLVLPQWISFRFSSSSCAGSGKTRGSRSMR